MIQAAILESDPAVVSQIKEIFDSFSPDRIQTCQAHNASHLLKICKSSDIDLIAANPLFEDPEKTGQVLDQIHELFPSVQTILILDSNSSELLSILRTRSERFLLRPFVQEHCERIIYEALLVQKQLRTESRPPSSQGDLSDEAKKRNAIIEAVNYGNGQDVLAALKDLHLSFSVAAGAVFAVSQKAAKLTGFLHKAEKLNIEVFQRKCPEAMMLMLFCQEPGEQKARQDLQKLEEYSRLYELPVWFGFSTTRPDRLRSSVIDSQRAWFLSVPMAPAFWYPLDGCLQAPGRWADLSLLGCLMQEDDFLWGVSCHYARVLSKAPAQSQMVLMEQASTLLQKAASLTWGHLDPALKQMKTVRLKGKGSSPCGEKEVLDFLWTQIKTLMSKTRRLARDPSIEYLRQIFQTICKNFQRTDFALEDLSEILNLSPGYICRIMDKYTGWSFISFMNFCRVNYAMVLLETDLQIKDVAIQSGFNSSSYFGKTFRKQIGLSPTEYRDRAVVKKCPVPPGCVQTSSQQTSAKLQYQS